MTDLTSPLFAPAEPGTIRRLARLAVAAMEPPPGPSSLVAGVGERTRLAERGVSRSRF